MNKLKTKLTIELTNPHMIARLIELVEDGRDILRAQGRKQRGLDGYTCGDLDKLGKALSEGTGIRCQLVPRLKIKAGAPDNNLTISK